MNEVETTALPCADKLAFDTKSAAEASAAVADCQHGIKLRPYQCTHCQLWHLSSVAKD